MINLHEIFPNPDEELPDFTQKAAAKPRPDDIESFAAAALSTLRIYPSEDDGDGDGTFCSVWTELHFDSGLVGVSAISRREFPTGRWAPDGLLVTFDVLPVPGDYTVARTIEISQRYDFLQRTLALTEENPGIDSDVAAVESFEVFHDQPFSTGPTLEDYGINDQNNSPVCQLIADMVELRTDQPPSRLDMIAGSLTEDITVAEQIAHSRDVWRDLYESGEAEHLYANIPDDLRRVPIKTEVSRQRLRQLTDLILAL